MGLGEDGLGAGWFDDPFLDSFFDGLFPIWTNNNKQIDGFIKVDQVLKSGWFVTEWFISGWFLSHVTWNKVTKRTSNWTKI